ncbi:MAG: L-ribulose-5-phosphate 4-epimerase [Spirochaetaceae bacterium 4572_59]|nr:MAG: L-ribulose-5-phosphate 4-epimerase [Spirochaetaceae bacterium 4572_59]
MYNLGLYEKSMPNSLSLEEKLFETAKAGFDFMEISIDESDEKLSRLRWSREERLSLIQSMWKSGTKILTMCLSGHRKYPLGSLNQEIREKSVEIMVSAIDLAQDLGIRIIQIAGYDEYYSPSNEKTRVLFTENLYSMVKYAAKKGVILAFETMETEFLNTVKKAMVFIDQVNSPYLQVYPDIGNISNAALTYGSTVRDDLERGSGHIAAMHMKETVPGKFREIPYGTGHVDFTEAFKIVSQMGTALFVGEFWYVGNEDWREQLKFSNNFLRSKMK